MARKVDPSAEEHGKILAEQLKFKRGEVWWYRQGAYVTTAILAAAIWFVMIGPKQSTPKTEMVEPATTILSTGVKPAKDLPTLSNELQFKVAPPDLKQLGGKLTKVGKDEFAGQPAAVFQYQYGKSVLLLYAFQKEPSLFKEMKKVHAAKHLFYLSSAGSVSVIAWKARKAGYFGLAAKATEKDLIALASKMALTL